MSTDVPDVITLCSRDFTPELLNGVEPLLITDGLCDWPSAGRWAPTLFTREFTYNSVDISVSLTGHFQYLADGRAVDPDNQFVIRGVSMMRAAEFILDETRSTPKYYVAQCDVSKHLAKLVELVRFPLPYVRQINLWFGSSGTVTPLHYDTCCNFYAQTYGSKQFRIFAPSDSEYLYAHPPLSRLSHVSRIDLESADQSAYPLLKNTKPNSFVVSAGQALFLPAYWWHHVRSETISISVSQWWTPNLTPIST